MTIDGLPDRRILGGYTSCPPQFPPPIVALGSVAGSTRVPRWRWLIPAVLSLDNVQLFLCFRF